MNKLILGLLLVSNYCLADTEAERLARYNTMMENARIEQQRKNPPSVFTGIPIKAMIEGGSLAYSASRIQRKDGIATLGVVGAASSMLPHVTDCTVSATINGRC